MGYYQQQLAEFRKDFLAGATTGIILSTCLASVAAMLILMNGTTLKDMIQLGIIVCVSMWYNASVLAQLKPRFVFNSLITSVLVSIVFIFLNIF